MSTALKLQPYLERSRTLRSETDRNSLYFSQLAGNLGAVWVFAARILAGRPLPCMRKGSCHRFKSRLGLEIGIKGQRPGNHPVLPPFRLIGLSPHDPAVAIRQAPGHHHLDRRFVESGIEKSAVCIGHETVADSFIRRGILIGDVQFGDLDRQTEAGDLGEKPPQHSGRK